MSFITAVSSLSTRQTAPVLGNVGPWVFLGTQGMCLPNEAVPKSLAHLLEGERILRWMEKLELSPVMTLLSSEELIPSLWR